MADPLKKLQRRVRDVLDRLLREGRPRRDIERAVDKVISNAGLAQDLGSQLRADVLSQSDWVAARTLSPIDRAHANDVFARSTSDYGVVGGRIRQSIVRAVETGLSRDDSRSEIERRLGKVFKAGDAQVSTVANTALGGFDRIRTLSEARSAGVTRMRYVGPPAQRGFCRDRLGRVFTLEEIHRMDNGQGLPVHIYCGGYNCRHTWEPVVEITDPSAIPLDIRFFTEKERRRRLQTMRDETMLLVDRDEPTAPIGRSIKEFVRVAAGSHASASRAALSLVERVHGVDGVNRIRILPSTNSRRYAAYSPMIERRGGGQRIEVNIYEPSKQISVVHELGHLIDDTLGSEPAKYASDGKVARGIMRAIALSRPIQELRRTLAEKFVDTTGPDGEEERRWHNSEWIKYLLDPQELFARAYTQYIVVKTGDPIVRAQLQQWEAPRRYTEHWTDEDFIPIKRAFDKLFARLKWQR